MSAFLSVDLLTDFAAFCLTDFIDWRYIHSRFVFSTQLVNCCPHGQRNYTCVLLPKVIHRSNHMYELKHFGMVCQGRIRERCCGAHREPHFQSLCNCKGTRKVQETEFSDVIGTKVLRVGALFRSMSRNFNGPNQSKHQCATHQLLPTSTKKS